MNTYESVLIVPGNLSQEETQVLADEFKNLFINCGVSEIELAKLEKKRFAHPIKKWEDGYYIILRFLAKSETLKRIEENLRHNEKILRSSFLRLRKR
uniref:Small ribosomal subunit protein bS6 n=1 Tax=candidate division WOR-3 bacterium TaxID=2052148 RepID=A0A7C3UZL3_UNCW3